MTASFKDKGHDTSAVAFQIDVRVSDAALDKIGGDYEMLMLMLSAELRALDWPANVRSGYDPKTDWDNALHGQTIEIRLMPTKKCEACDQPLSGDDQKAPELGLCNSCYGKWWDSQH